MVSNSEPIYPLVDELHDWRWQPQLENIHNLYYGAPVLHEEVPSTPVTKGRATVRRWSLSGCLKSAPSGAVPVRSRSGGRRTDSSTPDAPALGQAKGLSSAEIEAPLRAEVADAPSHVLLLAHHRNIGIVGEVERKWLIWRAVASDLDGTN
jgi:hypothetical protein